MPLIKLKHYIEIYIINDCNLTCSNCNRYNNYNFTGYYSWDESKDDIVAWSKRITAPMICIIGGEPSLHPELEQWAKGVAQAWPDVPVMIQTNGIKVIPNFSWWKPAIMQYRNLGTGIAIHNVKMKKTINEKWGRQGGKFDAWEFTDCALVDQDDKFTVHDSDPEQAWKNCTMSMSHTILNGKLYRCPMVAVLPEFRKQYRVDLTQKQEELLSQYKPLTLDCTDEQLEQFVLESDTMPLAQCNLCPEKFELSIVNFDPNRKKRPKIN